MGGWWPSGVSVKGLLVLSIKISKPGFLSFEF